MPIVKEYKNHISYKPNYYLANNSDITGIVLSKISLGNVRKMDDKVKYLETLLINLKIGYESDNWIGYSRNRNFYTTSVPRYSIPFWTYTNVIGVVDALAEAGLVNKRNGYNILEKRPLPARVKPTEALEAILGGISMGDIMQVPLKETVILRNQDKEEIGYIDTDATNKMRDNIKLINFVRENSLVGLGGVSIELIKDDVIRYSLDEISSLSTDAEVRLRIGYLHRVFNEDFTRGGRFYGSVETSLERGLRKYITINNKPTVEIDFEALHINMLYHQLGVDYHGDPYKAVCGLDLKKRKYFKKLMLISINAKDKESTVKAFRSLMNESNDNYISVIGKLTDSNIQNMLDKIEKAHPLISDSFYSNAGAKLMNIDSQIAENVMLEFAKKERTCLCVHDSFIVEKKFKKELSKTMKAEYKKLFGFGPKGIE